VSGGDGADAPGARGADLEARVEALRNPYGADDSVWNVAIDAALDVVRGKKPVLDGTGGVYNAPEKLVAPVDPENFIPVGDGSDNENNQGRQN